MKILTEQEIALWLHIADEPINFARAIESAVLEKLNAQEPMCWTNDTELSYSQFKRPDGELTSGSFWAEYHEDCDTPLYTNPLPLDDVVRDAERYRFLRDEAYLVNPVVAVVWKRNDDREESEWVNTVDGYSLDCHIDAAMKELK